MNISSPIWSNFFRNNHGWVRRTSAVCERNPLFSGVPPKAIRWLVSRMHLRQYEEGEVVFHMGDPGAGAVLVLSGCVKIKVRDVLVAELVEGDLFGEVALASSLPRTAEAVSVSFCELVFFLRSDLEEWRETSPKQAAILLVNLSNMLAHRLMEANKQYSHSSSACSVGGNHI